MPDDARTAEQPRSTVDPRFALTARRLANLLGLYGVSRALGLAREVGVAYFFGTSAAADRLNATFALAALGTIVLTEGLYAVAVASLPSRPSGATAPETGELGALLRTTTRSALGASLIYVVVGPLLAVLVLDAGHHGAAQTVLLAILLTPTVAAAPFIGAFSGALTLQGRVGAVTASQFALSLGAIAGIAAVAIAGRTAGPAPVAAGWSAGNVAAAVVLSQLAARDRRGRGPSAVGLGRRAWSVGIPVALAYSLTAWQAVIDRTVAARLGRGAVAALGYADRLFLLPLGFVLTAISPLVLGGLASVRSGENIGSKSIEQLKVVAPASGIAGLLLVGFGPEFVDLVYHYGAFGTASAAKTVRAVDGLALGMGASAVSLVLFRTIQITAPLRALVSITAVALAVNGALTVVLGALIGIFGIAVATSVAALLTVVLQLRVLGREFDRVWRAAIARVMVLPVCIVPALGLPVVLLNHSDHITRGMRAGLCAAGAAALAGRYRTLLTR